MFKKYFSENINLSSAYRGIEKVKFAERISIW